MLVVPIVLVLAGYWVAYSGVKHVTLLDAWRCTATPAKTPVGDPGGIQKSPPIQTPPIIAGGDCAPQKGDTVTPAVNGVYFIWRPIGSGFLGQLNGKIVGPCFGG